MFMKPQSPALQKALAASKGPIARATPAPGPTATLAPQVQPKSFMGNQLGGPGGFTANAGPSVGFNAEPSLPSGFGIDAMQARYAARHPDPQQQLQNMWLSGDNGSDMGGLRGALMRARMGDRAPGRFRRGMRGGRY